jgi:hypothetical protein
MFWMIERMYSRGSKSSAVAAWAPSVSHDPLSSSVPLTRG